jgi:hypothetical protein
VAETGFPANAGMKGMAEYLLKVLETGQKSRPIGSDFRYYADSGDRRNISRLPK